MTDLSATERDLLQWLSESDLSQYGECHGDDLDSLVAKGLAQIHGEETEMDNPFIAQGHGIMYRAVSLTDAGRELLRGRVHE
jgi:hypothetical protein